MSCSTSAQGVSLLPSNGSRQMPSSLSVTPEAVSFICSMSPGFADNTACEETRAVSQELGAIATKP